jgi:two-component system, chemotaxis family, chemotaxis protein CheY
MEVLIIEDDPGVRGSFAEVLRDEGYEVLVAADGAEALALLNGAVLPSLILLDLMMPNMDGVEFRARQLADPRLAKIPIIVVSARPDGERRAKQLAADDFLAKPMSFEALIHVIQHRALTAVTPMDERLRARTLDEAYRLLRTRSS